ncbi:unnamed protein product, partial [Callosobruchus maculatus]
METTSNKIFFTVWSQQRDKKALVIVSAEDPDPYQ